MNEKIIERIDELLGGLYPWQTEYLQCAMQVRYAGLSIPRGAGKSHLAAALALATLEQAEQPGEVAIVSATVAQATYYTHLCLNEAADRSCLPRSVQSIVHRCWCRLTNRHTLSTAVSPRAAERCGNACSRP